MVVHVRQGVVIPDAELTVRFTPSGGPGGQHANRSSTRVELVWDIETSQALDPTTRARLLEALGPRVRIVADDERSQTRNRELAEARLQARVEAALHVPERRVPTKPSRSSKRKRVEAKRRRGQRKQERRRPAPGDD